MFKKEMPDTPRAKTGKPTNPQIAIKENLALTGMLACELCGKKYDKTMSGAKVFKIDSTSDGLRERARRGSDGRRRAPPREGAQSA